MSGPSQPANRRIKPVANPPLTVSVGPALNELIDLYQRLFPNADWTEDTTDNGTPYIHIFEPACHLSIQIVPSTGDPLTCSWTITGTGSGVCDGVKTLTPRAAVKLLTKKHFGK